MPGPWSLTRSRTCPGSRASVHRDRRRRRGRVLNGVLQHVQHEPAQQVLVAAYTEHRSRRARRIVTPRSVASTSDGAPAVGDDLVEIQVDRPQRIAAGVGAREHQHVVDEPAEPLRLAADDRQRLAVFGFVAMLAAERDVRRARTIDTGVRSSCDASAMNCRCVCSASRDADAGRPTPGTSCRRAAAISKRDRDADHASPPAPFVLLAADRRRHSGRRRRSRTNERRPATPPAASAVHAPRRRAGDDAPSDTRGADAVGSGGAAPSASVQTDPSRAAQRASPRCVEDRDGPARRRHRARTPPRRRRRRPAFAQLVAERRSSTCRRERRRARGRRGACRRRPCCHRTTAAPKAQHDEQRERVPERQPRAQRQRRSSASVAVRARAGSLRRAACGSATPIPARSSLRRSRCT